MIEIVYKEKAKETEQERRLALPKNVRQIGEPEAGRRIYIEDYVITYLRRFAKEEVLSSRGAILLGHAEQMDGIPYLFIRSAIALKGVEAGNEGIPFTDEVWGQVYRDMKEYFTGQDILGWYLTVPGYPVDINARLLKTHVNYFGGVDKVLMVEDPMEGEEDFFAYENGKLTRQRGYQIFYERNEAMQRYMVETGDGESTDIKEKFEDRAMKNFRAIVQEKKEMNGQKRVLTFLYMASTFLVMVVLVIGITLINNYEKMEGLEMALHDISQSLDEEEAVFAESAEAMAEKPQEAAAQPKEEAPEKQEIPKEEQKEEQEEAQSTEAFSREAEARPGTYVVKDGDTLLKISRNIYGSEEKIPEICDLNGIDDSDRILSGQKLLLP